MSAPQSVHEMVSMFKQLGGVMVSCISSAASARVAIALQSVNTSEASRCQLL